MLASSVTVRHVERRTSFGKPKAGLIICAPHMVIVNTTSCIVHHRLKQAWKVEQLGGAGMDLEPADEVHRTNDDMAGRSYGVPAGYDNGES